MGHSNTIKDQSALNEEFRKYLDEQNVELNKATAAAKEQMAKEIQDFYQQGGWSDAKPVSSGAYQHLATASEWSLAHVSQMIDGIRGAIFGGGGEIPAADPNDKTPLPADAKPATAEAVSDQLKQLVAISSGTGMIIANAAFQVISGILAAFKSSTSTDIVKDIKQKDIIPGLSMFICVMENKYHRSDFFSDEMIVQNFYIFDVRMSASRAADLARFDAISSLILQQHDLEKQATDLSAQVRQLNIQAYKDKFNGNLMEAIKSYKADLQLLTSTVDLVNDSVAATTKLIDDLRAKKVLAANAMIADKHRELLAM